MTNGSLASNRIVDLLRYKAERKQRRLDFTEPAPAGPPSLVPITPFRPLTQERLRHRERMLVHLTEESLKRRVRVVPVVPVAT